ncbi:MAG: HesA/MoeB/ThiF family protein [Verrucomicrobia bacterium]|nr:HesA/MoeB/ThiF family protein [Verrucomicrobiota bacterium]MCH8510823.1 HesA/MoeB/ThiF family protein [Kiritimatiellia bacterium]
MLTDEEKARYEWQMWTPGVGEAGQERLKNARVLISRCGGVGSVVAYELAAAGVGKLVLAHAGNIKPSDLNRQLLMTHDALGTPRMDSVLRRLRDLNPLIELVGVKENLSEANAADLVGQVDLVVDCAPLFVERYAMNDACVRLGKPMVECAMFDGEAYLTTFVPGVTGDLRSLFPEPPPEWKREFPVFGAVSGTIACMAAYEAIKCITQTGELLTNTLLHCDLQRMRFRRLPIQ